MGNKIAYFLLENPAGQVLFVLFCLMIISVIYLGNLVSGVLRRMVSWCDWENQ